MTGQILCNQSIKAGSFRPHLPVQQHLHPVASQKCKYFSNCLNLSPVKIAGIPGICNYHVESSGAGVK